jgi:SAM-dependent methyltransferase
MKLTEKLRKYGYHQSFFPNIFSIVINPFYLARKEMCSIIAEYAIGFKGKMLDFGCGRKPYKSLFPYVEQYIGIDFENEGHNHKEDEKKDIDMFYDGHSLPFPDNYFDCAICTEVLEHVPDIDESLTLLKRVLKNDAQLIITLPFVWPEHEMPFDFRRFTVNGLTQKLRDHGFEINKTYKNGNYASVIVEMQIMFLHHLLYTKNRYLNMLINAIFISPFTLIGIVLSAIFHKYDGLYFNSILLVSKKD